MSLLGQTADDFGPSSFDEARQLFQVVVGSFVVGQLNADQNGRLALYALLTVNFFHYGMKLLGLRSRPVRQRVAFPRAALILFHFTLLSSVGLS